MVGSAIGGIITLRKLYIAGAVVAGVVAVWGVYQLRLASEREIGRDQVRAEVNADALEELERVETAKRRARDADAGWQYECVFGGGDCRVQFVRLFGVE